MALFTANETDVLKSSLRTVFVPPNQESNLKAEHVLGVVRFSRNSGRLTEGLGTSSFPCLTIDAAQQGTDGVSEVWLSARPVKYRTIGNIRFASDGENLFGCTTFGHAITSSSLSRLTHKTYLDLFRYLNRLGYPNLFRMWNYIPRINQEEEGLERYRAFCMGRSRAFHATFKNPSAVLPAATGIAKNADIGVDLYFLASRNKQVIHLENPRQTPAYKYPVKYGPKPPSFSRASYVPRNDGNFELYVSGTASVVGSRSVYPDNVKKQCATTLENIELLIGKSNLENYNIAHSFSLNEMDNLKVYYRRQSDLPAIREICEQRFSAQSQIAYLHVDICRADLLVEIEGSINSEKRKHHRIASQTDGSRSSYSSVARPIVTWDCPDRFADGSCTTKTASISAAI